MIVRAGFTKSNLVMHSHQQWPWQQVVHPSGKPACDTVADLRVAGWISQTVPFLYSGQSVQNF